MNDHEIDRLKSELDYLIRKDKIIDKQIDVINKSINDLLQEEINIYATMIRLVECIDNEQEEHQNEK